MDSTCLETRYLNNSPASGTFLLLNESLDTRVFVFRLIGSDGQDCIIDRQPIF